MKKSDRIRLLIMLALPVVFFLLAVCLTVFSASMLENSTPYLYFILGDRKTSAVISEKFLPHKSVQTEPETDPVIVPSTEPASSTPTETEPAETNPGESTPAETKPGKTPEVDPKLTKDDFPVVTFGSQWATLNVDGWKRNKDIPVYLGDNTTVLKKGAGMLLSSRFPGQGGKCVLTAHCLTHFYELEDTKPGTTVRVSTRWGEYVYKVEEMIVFGSSDETTLFDKKSTGDETLLLYTCYPRSSALTGAPKRAALVCRLVSGTRYSGYDN